MRKLELQARCNPLNKKDMKSLLITLFLCGALTLPDQGYITDLGKGFYFSNSTNRTIIYFDPSFDDTSIIASKTEYKIVRPIVYEVERFGFDTSYIFAVSKKGQKISYWLIDKTKQSEEIHYKEGVELTNVSKMASSKFYLLLNQFNLAIHPVEFYKRIPDQD